MEDKGRRGKADEMDVEVRLNGESDVDGSELMLQHVYISTVTEADVKTKSCVLGKLQY